VIDDLLGFWGLMGAFVVFAEGVLLLLSIPILIVLLVIKLKEKNHERHRPHRGRPRHRR
jgi:hypothetical protein